MKVLRFFGWLFIPYILLFFRWKRIRVFSRVLFILWSFLLLAGMFGSTQQDPQPVTAAAAQPQSVNKPVQEKNSKPTTSTVSTAAAPKSVPKQPSQSQLNQPNLAELQSEYKNAKTYQDKMNVIRQLVTVDKSYFLNTNPSVEDLGFAGDLFITTGKNTVKQLSSVGDQVISQQANGMYLEVQVTLSDVGNNPIEANADMFTLTTTDGRSFSTDIKAEMMLSKPIITDTLNPGVDDTGFLIFDVPPGLPLWNVTLNVQNGFHNAKLKLS